MRLPRLRRPRTAPRFLQPVLRPARGRKLPMKLWPARVGRVAHQLPDGLFGEAFENLLQRIDASPIYPGNEITVYFHGEDAFAAMGEAVRGATREVLLESYIFKDDSTGKALLAELAAAVGRGVTVRVLADALGSSSTKSETWREAERQGIAVRLFNPLIKRLWYQPFRDHRKILVVDGHTAFTGGMNIGEEYGSSRPKAGQGKAKPDKPHPEKPTEGEPSPSEPAASTSPESSTTWRDSHARLVGPAAWEMAIVFSEGWLHAGGEAFALPPLELAAEPVEGARVLVLDARPWRGNREAASVLLSIAAAAKTRLWITNAYFAPGHVAIRVLARAARRGVDVRLLLPGKTDVPLVRHAGHGYFTRLLRRGVRIFEYERSILHSKSMVADSYVSVLGSTNLDFRSFLFNAECNLVILDKKNAATLERAFEDDLTHAVEIKLEDWKRRALLHRWGDRMARWLSPFL